MSCLVPTVLGRTWGWRGRSRTYQRVFNAGMAFLLLLLLSRAFNHHSTGSYEPPPLLTTGWRCWRFEDAEMKRSRSLLSVSFRVDYPLPTYMKTKPRKIKCRHHGQIWCPEPRSLETLCCVALTCRELVFNSALCHSALFTCLPFCVYEKKEKCPVILTLVILNSIMDFLENKQ